MRTCIFTLLVISLVWWSGCTIRTPEVTFTSERTALEKQILGYYRTIEEDAMLVSIVPSDTAVGLTLPDGRREILEAFANRKFNADDLEDFGRDGSVGENQMGLLTIFPTELYQQDSVFKALVDRIVSEENQDREIIMTRIASLHNTTDPTDSSSVRQVFASMNRDAAPKGTLIENSDGVWSRK
ncbi:DUF1318 domain-containing protein [bacterium]|nr:DUF1318 domain-containing protein [bacterium]